MRRWEALFDEYRAQEAERLELERRAREAEALRRDLEAWSRRAVEWLLGTLLEGAEKRADELALASGVRIAVKPPRVSRGRQPQAEVTFIQIGAGADSVYLYAYHELGSLPLLHYLIPAWDGYLERTRHPRWVSLPGCRLLRGRDDRVVLEQIDLEGSARKGSEPEVDDLLFRAFELLLRGRPASRAARFRLPEAEPAPPESRALSEPRARA